jgi:membrane-associated phospholipid phosphatase
MSDTLLPVDRLLRPYNVLLAVLWLAALPLAPYAGWIAGAHVAAAGLPWLLTRAGNRLTPFGRVAREAYPLIWLLGFWTELGYLLPLLHPVMRDAAITGLDLAVFGRHWSSDWMERMPERWVSEGMYFAYFIYLPLVFLPPLFFGIAGRTDAMRDITARLLLTYVGCYLVYLLFPVEGPRHLDLVVPPTVASGFFRGLSEAARSSGDSIGTAFPSSHAAGAVTIALACRRWCPRWLGWLLGLEAVGVVLSTVYTQNHYAIDAVAGTALALLLQTFVAPALGRHASGAGVASPVPILPRFAPAFAASARGVR